MSTLSPPPSGADIATAPMSKVPLGKLNLHSQWLAWFQQLWMFVRTLGANGTTAQRPAAALFVGQQYFDTTLGYMVAVKTVGPPAVWVNGAGGVV